MVFSLNRNFSSKYIRVVYTVWKIQDELRLWTISVWLSILSFSNTNINKVKLLNGKVADKRLLYPVLEPFFGCALFCDS